MNLKPCPFRHVDDEGHILCDKIKLGEREVTPAICRACPVAAIGCAHLRGTLDHHARPPITVRWGNGKSTVLEDAAPTITLHRAACAQKVIPIHAPRDCAGCPLRQPLAEANLPARVTSERRARVAAPVALAAPPPPTAAEAARQSVVAQKIVQLQEWLTKQKHDLPREEESRTGAPIGIAPASPHRVEERRAGWTD